MKAQNSGMLPESIKSAENLKRFKRLIGNREGPQCNCSVCGFLETRNLIDVTPSTATPINPMILWQ